MRRRLVFDTETNGRLNELTKIHCLAIQDFDTGECFSFADASQTDAYPDIQVGLNMLETADEIVAHNGIGFDIPAIRKVYPTWDYSGRCVDTMILSRFIFSNIKDNDFKLFRRGQFPAHLLMKNHSIEAWGYRLNVGRKGDFDGPWDNWTQVMHDYMLQDVVVLKALYTHILKQNMNPVAIETELEVAEWLQEQKTNGFKFDVPAAVKLYTETLLPRRVALEEPLKARFKSWYVPKGPEKIINRTTRYTRAHLPDGVKEVFVGGATYQPVERVLFNPSSRQHIARVLQKEYGWSPQEFTDSGEAQVSDDIIGALPYDIAPLLTEYLLVDKRIGALAEGKQAWLKLVSKEGFIHGNVNQTGAATHRASHSSPNVSQVPSVDSPYGKECRALFTVPAGWKLVGSDASGCQLRCLAHYMGRYDGGAYTEAILHGDIHTINWTAGKPYLTSRGMAKTFIYAFLFGAGNWKVGHTCRPLASEEEKVSIGTSLKRTFLRNLPALGELVKAVEVAFEKNKRLVLLDGHVVHVKQKHTALNYLLQGTEAIICKRWIFHLRRMLKAEGLKSGWDGDYAAGCWSHDEVQVAVRDVDGLPEHIGKLATSIFPIITEELKFRCPLAGEFKVGLNWADTH